MFLAQIFLRIIFFGFVEWCGLDFKSQNKTDFKKEQRKARENTNMQNGGPHSAAFWKKRT